MQWSKCMYMCCTQIVAKLQQNFVQNLSRGYVYEWALSNKCCSSNQNAIQSGSGIAC